MRLTFSTSEILVFDDLLHLDEMNAVWRLMQSNALVSVHNRGWNKAWKFGDGAPLRGDVVVSSTNNFDRDSAHYPTDTAIDSLVAKLNGIELALKDCIGERDRDWTHFFVRPYVYGSGSGLSWHRDNQEQVSGAFTYYCHPRWAAHWGGELLVADASTKNAILEAKQNNDRTHFDSSEMDKHVCDVGVGTYIFPKPNRLVVICSGILHCIKKVDAAAGENLRTTYQGFFFRAPSAINATAD